MSWRRTVPSWTAACALFLQALIPFAQALPSPDTAEALVICTQFGPRALETSQNTVNGQQRTADRTTCAVCMSIDTVRLQAVSLHVETPVFLSILRVTYPGGASSAVASALENEAWPRAPPRLT